MMNDLSDLTDDWVEFEGLTETISLEPAQYEQALELSEQAINDSRKWSIYLQALALFSFEEWLQKREPGIALESEQASVWQPQYTQVIDAICNLKVGEFKVCLIPTISFADEEVTVSRVIVDLPEFIPHFYVIIGVEEELELASILGFLRYDQLINYKSQLQPEADWTYQLPLAWFNRESDELLLYLQCLDPTAIPLPEIPANRQATLARMQATLLTLLPQMRNRPLWDVLTWEQGVAVLTTPALLHWLYQFLTENTINVADNLSELLQNLTQQAVNVREWLGNRVNEVMQNLYWQVLPAASPLRGSESISVSLSRTEETPAQDLEAILIEISRSHQLEIPASAGRAYRDLTFGCRLRLFAVVWSLPEDEWTLLLILKVIAGTQPHHSITLQVSDQTEILAEELLEPDGNQDYIFTQVVGSYEDKFIATITSEIGEMQTLPPFEFSRE